MATHSNMTSTHPRPPSQSHNRNNETTQLPDWETPRDYNFNPISKPTTYKPSFKQRAVGILDHRMPGHKRYFGMKRRVILVLALVVLLLILALIIGLAVGLSKKKAEDQFLPLPSDKQKFKGDLTYYGPGLGACGVTSFDTDMIVSMSHFLFDHVQTGSNPNANPLCGLKLRATRVDERTGKERSVDLTVVDRCTGCKPTDIDVSPGAFDRLAGADLGRVTVTWAWLSDAPS